MSDNEFEKNDSGAANFYFAEAGRMKPGSLIMMKGAFPCRVVHMSTAKPGKHGSAKAMISAKDIFTDKQYEESFGTGDNIPAPTVTKVEYVTLDVDNDGVVTLLTPDGDTKEDLSFPTENHLSHLNKKIREILAEGKKECLITVQKWGDTEQIISVREGQD